MKASKKASKKSGTLFDLVHEAFQSEVPTPGQIRTFIVTELKRDIDYDGARNLQRRLKTVSKSEKVGTSTTPTRQRYSVDHG